MYVYVTCTDHLTTPDLNQPRHPPAFGCPAARQEVVEERGAARAYVGVETTDGEHSQAVEHCLGGAGDVREEPLGKEGRVSVWWERGRGVSVWEEGGRGRGRKERCMCVGKGRGGEKKGREREREGMKKRRRSKGR